MSDNLGLSPQHVLRYVVRPALDRLGKVHEALASPAAMRLVLGTMVYESRLKWLHQLAGGPAMGLCQMEPTTFLDLWKRAVYNKPLFEALQGLLAPGFSPLEQMNGNLYLQAAMCRILYWFAPGALPGPQDVAGLAAYYKKYYNTSLGKGKAYGWEHDYHMYVDEAFDGS